MKKDAYYFSHDCNARKDEKVLTLLAEHGYEGYGLYWSLIEMMFENQDTAISRKLLKGIAYDLRVDITLLQKIITTCYNTNLFQADKDKIWSNSLRRRKAEWEEKKKKRSEAGKLGMAHRWGSNNNVIKKDNGVITPHNNTITKERKGKEIKENRIDSAPTQKLKTFKHLTENEFYYEIEQHAISFPKEMLKAFFDYWSEKSPSGKMKFQLEQTWELKKRLDKWQSNDERFSKNKLTISESTRSGPPLKRLA